MTNETIKHYGFHPGGGYQPPETNKKKCQFPPESSGWHTPNKPKLTICPTCGITHDNTETHNCEDYPVKRFPAVQFSSGTHPSELERKIREDVMKILGEICHSYEYDERVLLVDKVKDRLNLLWGE